jgi:hypothetical protein
MRVGATHYDYRNYGISQKQEEALFARQTDSPDDMLRIAKNSKDSLVLNSLALNPNLKDNPEVVEKLFESENKGVHRRLENLGYQKSVSILDKIFG